MGIEKHYEDGILVATYVDGIRVDEPLQEKLARKRNQLSYHEGMCTSLMREIKELEEEN